MPGAQPKASQTQQLAAPQSKPPDVAEVAKPKAGEPPRPEGARVDRPGLDGRTNAQIPESLQQQTGKGLSDLTLGLGAGPMSLSPRELEARLVENGTIAQPPELRQLGDLARMYWSSTQADFMKSVGISGTDWSNIGDALQHAGLTPRALDAHDPYARHDALDNVLVRDPSNPDRWIETGKSGDARTVRAAKEAGQAAHDKQMLEGFLAATWD